MHVIDVLCWAGVGAIFVAWWVMAQKSEHYETMEVTEMAHTAKAPTFEEINAHVERLDMAKFQPGGSHHFTPAHVKSSPSDVLLKVCALYHAAQPVLAWVAWVPLPAKWKQVLATFQHLMDGLCPSAE